MLPFFANYRLVILISGFLASAQASSGLSNKMIKNNMKYHTRRVQKVDKNDPKTEFIPLPKPFINALAFQKEWYIFIPDLISVKSVARVHNSEAVT